MLTSSGITSSTPVSVIMLPEGTEKSMVSTVGLACPAGQVPCGVSRLAALIAFRSVQPLRVSAVEETVIVVACAAAGDTSSASTTANPPMSFTPCLNCPWNRVRASLLADTSLHPGGSCALRPLPGLDPLLPAPLPAAGVGHPQRDDALEDPGEGVHETHEGAAPAWDGDHGPWAIEKVGHLGSHVLGSHELSRERRC